jgi:hypothetical protein
MRPNRRLHSELFSSSTRMRLVLPAPGFDLVSICSSRGFRLVPARAAFFARRPPVLRRGSGHRRARGPSMRARPGDGAFSRRASPLRRLGRSSAGRCLPPRRSRRTAFWHPCRLLRFMRERSNPISPHVEGRRDRFHTPPREKGARFPDPRCLPSSGVASTSHLRARPAACVDLAVLT